MFSFLIEIFGYQVLNMKSRMKLYFYAGKFNNEWKRHLLRHSENIYEKTSIV